MADVSAWDKTKPSGASFLHLGDDQIRSDKSIQQAAWEQEHYFKDSPSNGGVHKPGSARAYFGNFADIASISSVNREGRLFYAYDKKTLYFLTPSGAEAIGSSTSSGSSGGNEPLAAPYSVSVLNQNSCSGNAPHYQIKLVWSAGDATASTRVYVDATTFFTLSPGVTQFIDHPAGPGTYTYKLQHFKGDNNSALTSKSITFANPCGSGGGEENPPPPQETFTFSTGDQSFCNSGTRNSRVRLVWTRATGAYSISLFRGGVKVLDKQPLTNYPTNSFEDAGASPGTFIYTATQYNISGAEVATQTAQVTVGDPCVAPKNLRVQNMSDCVGNSPRFVTRVMWDSTYPEASIEVYRNGSLIRTEREGNGVFDDTPPAAGTYIYKARRLQNGSSTAFTADVSVTVVNPCTGGGGEEPPPGGPTPPPTVPRADLLTVADVRVSWGNAAAAPVRIERQQDSLGWEYILTAPASTTSTNDILTSPGTYVWRLRHEPSSGEPSNWVQTNAVVKETSTDN